MFGVWAMDRSISWKNLAQMARPLLQLGHATSSGHAGLTAATLLLCVVAVAMCASHGRRRWSRLITSRRYSAGPVIQLDMDPRIQPGEDETGNGGQVCVWQKKILMGDKCQLPDFSGIVAYDSDGKLITPAMSRIAMK